MAFQWAKRAAWYKQNNEFAFALTMRSAIPFLETPTPTKICQVSCASGLNLLTLRQLYPNASIYASDLEEEMIHFALQRKVPNTSICVADNMDLPYQDNYFDLYVAGLCLNFVSDPNKMLSEAYRVLKPGGKAYFSVAAQRQKATYIDVLEKIMQYEAPYQDHKSKFHFGFKEKAIESLESQGFRDIITYTIKIPMPVFNTSMMLQHFENFHIFQKLTDEQKEDVKRFIDSVLVPNEPLYFFSRAILANK